MNKRHVPLIITCAALGLICGLGLLGAQNAPSMSAPDFNALLRKTDQRMNFPNTDMAATLTMVNVDPEKGTMTHVDQLYRRDRDDAFVMITLEPESRRGQGMLRVDNDMWRYDPKSRKFTHVAMREQYGDTSARNSDFRKARRAEDYKTITVSSGTLGKYEVWIAELEAANTDVAFPYIKMWVRKDENLVLKVEEYSLSKRLLRTAYYTNYVQIGDTVIPTSSIYQDGLIANKRTQVTMTNISTATLPDYYFNKSFLERMGQ